jgi:RNA polymerase sigma-70 factor, ECF subfamily
VERSSDDRDADQDRALVERAQAGDMAAFRTLYDRHASAVYRFAIVPMVGDPTLAEDLLADTFVRALENLHRFQWQGKGVLPWFVRIAKNICLDHLRKSGRVGDWPMELDQIVPDPQHLDGERHVEAIEIGDLMRERIDVCLAEINPRYRRVLELRLVHNTTREQAASEMGVSIGTLDVLLFRACKAFRRIYVTRWGVEPQQEF